MNLKIRELLMCPKCKGNLNENLVCLRCGEGYEYTNDVYSILYGKMQENYKYSTWNFDETDVKKTIAEYAEFQKLYDSYLNEETKTDIKMQSLVVMEKISNMSGVVLDVATGRALFLEQTSKSMEFAL